MAKGDLKVWYWSDGHSGRGRYTIAAHSEAEAARLSGESASRIKKYASKLTPDGETAHAALSQPGVLFRQDKDDAGWRPVPKIDRYIAKRAPRGKAYNPVLAAINALSVTQDKLRKLEAKLEKLKPYLDHKDDCNYYMAWHENRRQCDCGLAELLNE